MSFIYMCSIIRTINSCYFPKHHQRWSVLDAGLGYLPEGPEQVVIKCADVQLYVCIHRSQADMPFPAHWNPIGHSTKRRPAYYVIAQQYSSATFLFLRFHSRNQTFGTRFDSPPPHFYVFKTFWVWNCASRGSVCVAQVGECLCCTSRVVSVLRKSGSACVAQVGECLYFANRAVSCKQELQESYSGMLRHVR